MMSRSSRHIVPRIARRPDSVASGGRMVPEETPIAFSYNGTTHAVMMASPIDIEDFAVGFSLSEGIVGRAEDVREILVQEFETGIDVQISLAEGANEALRMRRRHMAGPVGCGLCGIESIEEAIRPVNIVANAGLRLNSADIARSVRLLSAMQPIHAETGAVHAAGFYMPGRGIVEAREDVGRHNALDKLAGALARQGIDGASGAVVVTSRVSVEMVQKSAIIGTPILIAVSAPTALALRTAEEAGMTVVALVRGDDFDVFTGSGRIDLESVLHVE